jgi:DNA repair ATPase RecN
MAKKKTTVQELQELIEATPKLKHFTDEQFKKLEDIYEKLRDARRNLGDLEGEENVSKIMFQVGSAYITMDKCEDELRDIIDSFDEDYSDCDECGNDF